MKRDQKLQRCRRSQSRMQRQTGVKKAGTESGQSVIREGKGTMGRIK
jgi:hypothetical protein